MKFKFSNYENGLHEIEFRESGEKFNFSEKIKDEIYVKCSLDKSSSQIVLRCSVNCGIEFLCDRCIENYVEKIESDFELVYVFDKDNYDPEDQNCKYLSPEQGEIDISDDVREFLYVSIPMKKICDENCKGICPGCGTSLNNGSCKCVYTEKPDPRWDKLKKMINDNNS